MLQSSALTKSIADGREVEEEKEQDCAYKDRISCTYESDFQQVSPNYLELFLFFICL